MVSNASDVKAVEHMRLSQSWHAPIRSDVGSKRLCHTGFIKGLFILAHMTPESVSLFVADLIPETYAQRILMSNQEALI